MLVWESWKLIIDFNFLFCFGVFGVGQQHQQQQQQQQQQQVIMDDIEDIREENGSFFQVHKKTIVLVGVVAVIAVIWVVLVAVSSANWAPEQTLDTRVQTENIMKHLENFYQIALDNGNSRSIVHGYNDSAEYVISTLQKETGNYYQIRKEYFYGVTTTQEEKPTLSQVFPLDPTRKAIVFEDMLDFRQPRYGGNGSFSYDNVKVVKVEGEGCEKDNYEGVEYCAQVDGGCVALIPRSSTCTLYDSALLAQDAGALGLFASGTLTNTRVRDTWWTPDSVVISIPVLSITNSVASSLLSSPPSYVTFSTHLTVGAHPTYNVIAQGKGGMEKDGEERSGEGKRSVFVGAHLDSVPAGPGINDNGSGSGAVLEMAIQLAQIGDELKNPVRFAWWGAEEEGLIGSRHYVRELTDSEKARIAIYINHDMLASPNYIINVKNASDAPLVTQAGIVVQGMYEEYYQQRGVAYMNGPLQSGSDFLSFLEGGMPAQGLSAGAGEWKDDEGREEYGGLADTPLDPCYHRPCDTIANINQQCLTDISQATSNVLWSLLNKENLGSFLGLDDN